MGRVKANESSAREQSVLSISLVKKHEFSCYLKRRRTHLLGTHADSPSFGLPLELCFVCAQLYLRLLHCCSSRVLIQIDREDKRKSLLRKPLGAFFALLGLAQLVRSGARNLSGFTCIHALCTSISSYNHFGKLNLVILGLLCLKDPLLFAAE
jgi:hypothetical protein